MLTCNCGFITCNSKKSQNYEMQTFKNCEKKAVYISKVRTERKKCPNFQI